MVDLKLKRVSIRNWMKFRAIDIEFPEKGLVLVQGVNTASGGALLSVGSGKTGIGEAISRTLLGVPGLMRAWKRGNIGIANAPGAGTPTGVVTFSIDGLPAGLPLNPQIINLDLARRQHPPQIGHDPAHGLVDGHAQMGVERAGRRGELDGEGHGRTVDGEVADHVPRDQVPAELRLLDGPKGVVDGGFGDRGHGGRLDVGAAARLSRAVLELQRS